MGKDYDIAVKCAYSEERDEYTFTATRDDGMQYEMFVGKEDEDGDRTVLLTDAQTGLQIALPDGFLGAFDEAARKFANDVETQIVARNAARNN